MSHSEEETSGLLTSKKRKKIFLLSLFASLFIVSAIIGIVVGVKSKNSFKSKLLKSSCESTLYPDFCYSTLANSPELKKKKVVNQRDVIELSLNITIKVVKKNYQVIEKILKKKKLTKREKVALHDCLETIDVTLDELNMAVEDLELYPSKNSLKKHADDLKTLLSSAVTNPSTCIDGFSHDGADKDVRKALLAGQEHVEKMCSNALAMICNMTDTDIANLEKLEGRKLEVVEDLDAWPEWLSAEDLLLLQSSNVSADVVVAADGSGNYTTVGEAVAEAPLKSKKRYVIRIKSGVYNENVEVSKKKWNIMFWGDGSNTTIITGSKNVVDGSSTFKSATVAVVGQRFLARDITFENTAGPSKHQAVALRVGADLSAFYKCDIIAFQDSLYAHSNRQFFINCFIAGTVDFIFGNAAVVFQDCDIHARRPNPGQKNMVTAQGRIDPNQNTGIVIQKSRIGATSDLEPVQKNFSTFLGRPWKEFSRTVIMHSVITDVIDPSGWHPWSDNFALSTLFYGEYQNTGAGAGTSERVKWDGYRVITSASEAEAYEPGNFIAGGLGVSD